MKRILTPCSIGTCTIKNRFVMTAANLGWCEDGFVTKKVTAFYRERAKGHVGLLIAGAAGVDPVRVNQTGMMQIYDDRFIGPMRELTEAVHQEGSRIFLQLMHAGAYARKEEHSGMTAAAPSSYLCPFTREETEELTKERIREIIQWFADGALRAKKAGFDGVELIGSAGYLIAEFLSGATNRRTDTYGGAVEQRTRFLMEIIQAVRQTVGSEYPLMVRLSGADFIPDGNGPGEAAKVAALISTQVDAIDVTGGWHESQVPQITYNVPEGMYLYLAKNIKQAAKVSVIGCNRLTAGKAEEALEKGWADMAGMLRELIADPYLVRKYEEGRADAIRPCLACNQECLDAIFSGGGIGCVVNPLVGQESCLQGEEAEKDVHAAAAVWTSDGQENRQENGRPGTPAEKKPGNQAEKRILVIGAGVSGMVYAATTAKRGYTVTVWEKETGYGGAAAAVAHVPYRKDIKKYLDYLFRQCVDAGVRFCWRKEASEEILADLLDAGQYGRVILAAGADWEPPDYGQPKEVKIYRPEEVMRGEILPGRKIVIIGSGYKAVQTAQYCAAAEKEGDQERRFLERYAPDQITFADNIMKWGDPEITLLAPAKRAGGGFGKSTRWMMLKDIKKQGVTVETGVQILGLEKDRVLFRKDGEEKMVEADLIVGAFGWKKKEFSPAFTKAFADRVETIGDAVQPGRISEAVKQAFYAAMTLKEDNDV